MTGIQNLGDALYQSLIEFPKNALTITRQQNPNSKNMTDTGASEKSKYQISQSLYAECQSAKSVSALLAEDPSLTPGAAWKKLYGHYEQHELEHQDIRDIGKGSIDNDELEKARQSGNWGEKEPTELFLRLYHDALCTLNDKPANGVVSPVLMGSSGVVPLTIISVIPDIVRHMSNLIVRAEKEVFLATNFWQNGVASKYITHALRELSRRVGERGTKVVVKILYDRGSPKQLIEPHYLVSEKEYTGDKVGLPAKHEIPNVDLEVMNYHKPMLGTQHAKFMLVDRKIGIVQSNNIQDNDNLESMIQVGGPIVDSLYDMALLSWHKKLDPPLSRFGSPVVQSGILGFEENQDDFFHPDGTLKCDPVLLHPDKVPKRVAAYGPQADQLLDPTIQHVKFKGSNTSIPSNGSNHQQTGLPEVSSLNLDGSDSQQDETFQTQINNDGVTTAQAADLPEHNSDDSNYDDCISGEIARTQQSVSGKAGETKMQAVTRHLNHTTNESFKGDAPECKLHDEFTPLIPHPVHEPFPIALVNRPPYGPPNHKSVANPQNAVWLSAMRNAKKNVFIQSPTLNAEPLVPAIIEACERGIDVYCYICLGYNDAGELLPMQGGHNEMITAHLYSVLSLAGKQHLHYFWYVAKDQTKPLVAESKHRSCHIKIMIVDEHVGIVGSGNQDTQSWFHSQEVNIMIDSADVCRVWIDALRRNQNTHRYGAVSLEDGVWRGDDGKEAEGATGVDPGRFSWAKGVVGAVKRLQGTGGF